MIVPDKAKKLWIIEEIMKIYPDAHPELKASSEFQYLVAVMLSAQTTDVAVNKITPDLFKNFGTPEALANASIKNVESLINSIGLYHVKAKNIINTARIVVNKYNGNVPRTFSELISLPGVGEKTAQVVAGDLWGIPSFGVDTHISRIAKAFNISKQNATPHQIGEDIKSFLPKEKWIQAHHALVFFGRYHFKSDLKIPLNCTEHEVCKYFQKIYHEKNTVH